MKTMKNLNKGSWLPGRDLNPEPSEFESEVATLMYVPLIKLVITNIICKSLIDTDVRPHKAVPAFM
jgi:hypothetical protein